MDSIVNSTANFNIGDFYKKQFTDLKTQAKTFVKDFPSKLKSGF
jgi:hypothetical protein